LFLHGVHFNKTKSSWPEQLVFFIFDVFPHLNMDCLQYSESQVGGLEDDCSDRRFILCPKRFQPLPDGTFSQKKVCLLSFFNVIYQNFFAPFEFLPKLLDQITN